MIKDKINSEAWQASPCGIELGESLREAVACNISWEGTNTVARITRTAGIPSPDNMVEMAVMEGFRP